MICWNRQFHLGMAQIWYMIYIYMHVHIICLHTHMCVYTPNMFNAFNNAFDTQKTQQAHKHIHSQSVPALSFRAPTAATKQHSAGSLVELLPPSSLATLPEETDVTSTSWIVHKISRHQPASQHVYVCVCATTYTLKHFIYIYLYTYVIFIYICNIYIHSNLDKKCGIYIVHIHMIHI